LHLPEFVQTSERRQKLRETLTRNDRVDPDRYNEAADGDWLTAVRQRLSRRYPTMNRGYGRGGYGALSRASKDLSLSGWSSW
jgi:hypothetical protein